MNLIRYELDFFGEPQEVGFIQGLKDQGLNNKIIDDLICTFDKELAIPNYSEFKSKKGKYIASFFTEAGLIKFKKSINKIISFINQQENGFSVIKKAIKLKDTEHILYKDENQILIYLNRKF